MSRFNTAASAPTKTVNLAGGEAFSQTPELELVSILLTSFMKDQYYRSADDSIARLKELLAKVDPLFAAKAALYARNEFGMRSVSHVVAGELAGLAKGKEWAKRFYEKIVRRPDDMTEIMSYVYSGGNKETNPMRKGFAAALHGMDEYQLAKYKGEGKKFSLVDMANLTHPVSTPALKALVDGTLKPAETWETKMSEAGKAENAEEAKAGAWAGMLKSGKLGYMALIKNLRNILETNDQELVQLACAQLVNPELVGKSLVLPFRIQTASEEVQKLNGPGTQAVLVALSQALDLACVNVPKFPGRTLVALDNSGSMTGSPFEIGSLFAAVLIKASGADYMGFASGALYRTVNPLDSTLTIAKQLRVTDGGTNFHAIFDEANQAYDRIIILSDMQGWVGYTAPTSSFEAYVRRVGKRPSIYSFDLAGHGTMQFPAPQVYAIAGFSEKIFEVMVLLEQDRDALVNRIRAVEL